MTGEPDAAVAVEPSCPITKRLFHRARSDDHQIRQAAVQYGVPYTTTLAGAQAMVAAIESLKKDQTVRIRSLQEFHATV